MKNITITEREFLSSNNGSSKGYAKKVRIGGVWYKVSAGAFNAQAEVVAARLAGYTNVGDCVRYEMCTVNGDYASMSEDFLVGVEDAVTVKGLHLEVIGTAIEPEIADLNGQDRFTYVNDIVRRARGFSLTEPPVFRQLSLLLQFDALVLNEDRHFNNVKFVKKNGAWGMAAAFDFDCSLYSCLDDLGGVAGYLKPSLPFYLSHDEQLEWLYSMSDDRLAVHPFDVGEVTRGVWDERHTIGKREVEAYLADVSERAGFYGQI